MWGWASDIGRPKFNNKLADQTTVYDSTALNIIYLVQACSLLDSLLEFKLAVIFCCEPSHGLHDHPPPTPCTQFNESGRRFFYIK
jgi:hypothetical protein